MSKKYITGKIKEWRKAHNFSQKQVARKAGIGVSTWRKAELGCGVISGTSARIISLMTGLDEDLVRILAEPEDTELEQYAIEYNKTHPFKFDYCSRERLHLLKQKS